MNEEEIDKAQRYVLENITTILEKMTVDILETRPDGIVDYMIEWLDNKGDAALAEGREKSNRRPVGVESSESEDDEEEQKALQKKLEERRLKAKTQRCSVSAEVYGLYNPKGHFKPRVIPKDNATKEHIHELLSKIFMFRNLDGSDMDIILNALEVRKFEADQPVIVQGDDGHELFIVDSGKLSCSKRFPGQTKDTFLKNYQPGEYFGELALLYTTPRAASITATVPSVLFSLDRECFNHIVKDSAIKNRTNFEKFLSEVELLSGLDSYERSKICDCLLVQTFEAGQRVINEGEKGESFYLIVEGEATALKINPTTKKEEAVFEYKEKMYFGELALLKEAPRAASIVAKVF